MIDGRTVITLREYETVYVPPGQILEPVATRLWEHFGDRISVGTPSFQNGYRWELRSQGWVGYVPVSDELALSLQPKVSLKNLFGMWEYAYRLNLVKVSDDAYKSSSIEKLYERLAKKLAESVLGRVSKGLYREYVAREEELPYLRGQLDLRRQILRPWVPSLPCGYQEHTADIDDNRIVAWTLYAILRSGFCSEPVLQVIRSAFRNIGQSTSLQPYSARDCLGRLYNRLNQDYQGLHALCRFFLDNIGPTYELGDRTMFPFMVDMASLFELFVAEWLRKHLPAQFELRAQENVAVGEAGLLQFRIDLVIYDRQTERPLCVLDTKYKKPDTPSTTDFSQVVTYALLKECDEAVLVYPDWLNGRFEERIGNIRVRGLTFSLADDLDQGGQDFMRSLLGNYPEMGSSGSGELAGHQIT